MTTKKEIVEQFYRAWVRRDWDHVRKTLTDDFHFSSPVDNAIDVAAYQARCWPNGEGSKKFTLDTFMEDGDTAMLIYTWYGPAGQFRAAEHFTFADERIRKIDCFWGFLPARS